MASIPQSRGVEEAAAARAAAPVLAAVRVAGEPEPALLTAGSLALHWGARVEALCVVEPLGVYAAEPELAGALAEAERLQVAAARPRLIAHATEVAGAEALAAARWTTAVLQGPAPRTIAEHARDVRARAVVLGLGRHALGDRLFGSETAVRTLRLSGSPLLAVGRAIGLPARRIVAATDFSPAATAAARLACEVLAPGGTLTLVHAVPDLEDSGARWLPVRERVLPGLFAEQMRALDVPAGVHVEWTTQVGDGASAVLAVADRADAPLVAAGRHGITPIERLFLGSTTTALLRRSARAVLVAPPSPG